MAPVLALKFIFLAIRQVSKPLMKTTVARVQQSNIIIRSVCIMLGRFTLGISCVVAKWAADEKRAAAPTSGCNGAEGLLVTPRSRSLLRGDAGKKAGAQTQLIGKLFFHRRPITSTWQAFRSGYSSSTAEEELVSSGAALFTELLIYFLLALILFFELSYASKASEAKEKNLFRRIEALEQKVNELVKEHHEVSMEPLTVPEPVVIEPFGWLKGRIKTANSWLLEKLYKKE